MLLFVILSWNCTLKCCFSPRSKRSLNIERLEAQLKACHSSFTFN
uniref:Uncharacterized protein n=1 Tax=Anguilla anguilla TaxID=7936 RepID=A0A0E9T7N2_ANGAN